MNPTETQHALTIMAAYTQGREIQRIHRNTSGQTWADVTSPQWNWNLFVYRLRPLGDPVDHAYTVDLAVLMKKSQKFNTKITGLMQDKQLIDAAIEALRSAIDNYETMGAVAPTTTPAPGTGNNGGDGNPNA